MTIPLGDRTLARVLRDKALANGERPLLWFEGRSYSYAQAHRISVRLAHGLHAAGIRGGQHVAIIMENRPEVLWLHFALAHIGAVAVPVNTASRGDLLAYYVSQSDSVAVVLETAFAPRYAQVHADCAQVGLLILLDSESPPPGGVPSFGQTPVMWWDALDRDDSNPADFDASQVTYSDLLHVLYSSGTTGPSKASMVSNATAITAASAYAAVNGLVRDDILFTCLPLFHGNSLNCTVLPALVADATVALSRRFSARSFWREVGQCGATHTSLLSAMINILWVQEPSPREREHRLRMCQVVPVPDFAEEFANRYGVTITSLYSLSDFGLATILGPDAPREKVRSAGRPLRQVAVAILDEDDVPVPPRQIGEICLRNNEAWFARQGYYKMPQAWMAACRNLWFHTGDQGWFDEDGYLYFAGRKKDVIRRRGENISALEVEQVMLKHPGVANVAVFPVKAEFMEDEVMATVVLRDGYRLDAAELVEFCAPRMAYFMVPRFVEFVEELPTTPTGKVEKYKLRDAAQSVLKDLWDRERAGIVLEK